VTSPRATWLLTFPLLVGGSIAGHELGYWVAVPSADDRTRQLSASGHGWLDHLPLAAGVGGALLLAALALVFLSGLRGRRVSPPPLFFALLPLAAFAVQEHVERVLAHCRLDLGVALSPAFLAGLLLQLPFGAAALLLAEALTELAHGLGRTAAALPPPRVVAVLAVLVPAAPSPTPQPALARGFSERGPPRFLR
jgi:hypothetical protein